MPRNLPIGCSSCRTAVCLSIFALAFSGCASLNAPSKSLPSVGMPSFASQPASPGTREWWKKNKKKAVLVPNKGYQVAGVDGYFDQEGRPINRRVAKSVRQESSGGLLGDVKFTSAVNDVKNRVGLGPNEQAARTAFAEGEDLFRKEQYATAAKRFDEAVSRWPESELAQDAMFQRAESYFFAEKYPEAVDSYEALLQEYPSTAHLDKVIRRQFELARYWEKHHQHSPSWSIAPNLFDKRRPLFDTLGRAMKVYENIRLNDPTGPLADDAVMATANSYFLRGRYRDADDFYDLLRNEYPRSEHQYEAHMLGLQCKLRKYMGPDYDGTPLEEAKKLVRQLKVQFAGELDNEQRKQLSDIESQIAYQFALSDHNKARYYENKHDYGAARLAYQDLANRYPESSLATDARERIAALEGEPDRPDEPLGFLVELLPENAERAAVRQVPLLDQPADDPNSNEPIYRR